MSEFLIDITGMGPVAVSLGIWASVALAAALGFSRFRDEPGIDLHRHRHEGAGIGEEACTFHRFDRVRCLGGPRLRNPRNGTDDAGGLVALG